MGIHIDKLVRSRRRTVALQITSDARLKVFAPLTMPQAYIERLVMEKEGWIRQKIQQVRQRLERSPFVMEDGAVIYYSGIPYEVRLYDGVRICLGDKFYFPRDLIGQAKEELEFWFRQEAARILPQRAAEFSRLMGVSFNSIIISNAATRWGSCGPLGDIRFNWRLVMAPKAVMDYVVVHELAHILVRNHSARFWKVVAAFSPEYKRFRQWLRQHGSALFFAV